ncbi:MAG: glycosyl hydrolase [Alphaproteobacteria bacterium]|nr:glycosyl hydrolase [Alphaproteobacteria bacterium]MCB9696406.1 glycosyl hydrolase [Alphaproteobacteria bacterium]
MSLQLYISTRKGLWIADGGPSGDTFELRGPTFLGQQCHHCVLDPRDGRTLLLASRQWHLGPTVFRSDDGGRTFVEAEHPPRFAKGDARGRAVDHVFWLTPGHADEPGVWYCGTSPQGLFRSEDGGRSWEPVSGYVDHPDQQKWAGGDKDQTPDGGKLHSVLVDPRDPARLFVSMSGGGTFTSGDRGATWSPMNQGVDMDFAPPPPEGEEYPYGHDPHHMVQHPTSPDRFWQQNHCGIYRRDGVDGRWIRVGRNMPADVGDVGFPVVVHPKDPDTAFVFPMDGTKDWPRTPPHGRPAMYLTRDGGETWQRRDAGLPTEQAWWTVKRQAMCGDGRDPLGIYLGNTNGEVWRTRDEGASFECLFRHLPHVYAITAGEAS